jgi:hypothetical protein
MEIDLHGTVAGAPQRFSGGARGGDHESIPLRTGAGARVEVVANLDFMPWLGVRPGDDLIVRGELVRGYDGNRVVHWTHHDPGGRHVDGFIEWNGRRYA